MARRGHEEFEGPFGAVYSAYIERERLSRLIGRAVWGCDTRRMYASMGAVAEVGHGGTIVDAPCGSGVALRALGPGQRVRYVAVDLADAMLDRAARTAEAAGLEQVELVRADVTDLPLADGEADLFLSYGGLHCLPDPEAAVAEAARCLKRGGRLVGTTFTLDGRPLRARAIIRPGTWNFGPLGTTADLERWLADAGMDAVGIETSGPMAFFDATRFAHDDGPAR